MEIIMEKYLLSSLLLFAGFEAFGGFKPLESEGVANNFTHIVIDSALYESNEKVINEIYFSTIAKQDYHFSQNQINYD